MAEGHIRQQPSLACGACPSLRTLWALREHASYILFMYWFIYTILTFKWQWLAFNNLTPWPPKMHSRMFLVELPAISLNEKLPNAHEWQNERDHHGLLIPWSTGQP